MFPIKNLDDLKSLSERMKWQYFEKLVGWIFEKNGFETEVNKVIIFEKGRRQFDVVARRFQTTFLIECKKWSGKRSKTGLVKKVAERHIEKCKLYRETEANEVIPLVVTLMQEDIVSHENIPIVPIEKLNSFINHFEEFKDKIVVL